MYDDLKNAFLKGLKHFLQNNLFLKNGTCPICGQVLLTGDQYYCPACYQTLPVNAGPTCLTCGRPLQDPLKNTCRPCLSEKYPFSGGYAHFHYQKAGKKSIAALKFNNRPHLGTFIGQQMSLKNCPWIGQIDLIMAIPIHPQRLKDRGYNQSDFIAQGIFKQLRKTQGQPDLAISKTLFRSHHTAHQVGQSKAARRDNMIGAFDLLDPQEIAGKNILLVDDVLTTGATLGEAANTLIEGGAATVYIAVIAALSD